MGNQSCCQAHGTEVGNINIIDNSMNKLRIEQFLHKNKTIKDLLSQNHSIQKGALSDRDSFINTSQEYVLDDGVFIGQDLAVDNRRRGYGIMLYRDQSYYEGEWKDNMRCGSGVFASEDGQFYSGSWKDDLADGKGQFRSQRPFLSYTGDWLLGNKHGRGTQTYEDKSSYTGQFSNGNKHGTGRLVYADGTQYEGQFEYNQISGQGTFKGFNHSYEGGWKQGKMHGAGKSEWFDSKGKSIAKYIGEYNENIKHGYGQYTDSKGTVYKANWLNGEMNDRGPIITQKTV